MSFDFDNMYCGHIRRGDVVLCSVDGVDIPCVVVQDSVLNGGLPTILCAEITQKKHDSVITEVVLSKEETGLGAATLCLMHRIHTIDRHACIAKKGELKAETMVALFHAFDIVLGRFRDR